MRLMRSPTSLPRRFPDWLDSCVKTDVATWNFFSGRPTWSASIGRPLPSPSPPDCGKKGGLSLIMLQLCMQIEQRGFGGIRIWIERASFSFRLTVLSSPSHSFISSRRGEISTDFSTSNCLVQWAHYANVGSRRPVVDDCNKIPKVWHRMNCGSFVPVDASAAILESANCDLRENLMDRGFLLLCFWCTSRQNVTAALGHRLPY